MKLLSLFILLVLSVTLGFGQTQGSDEKIVMFDPLFWKEELKLKPEQCRRISEINYEFYNTLTEALQEQPGNVTELKIIASESLQHRSQRILETFHGRQKKKWNKISRETAVADSDS
jgi:hypothetical protein